MLANGWSIEEIREEYDFTGEQIKEAIEFEKLMTKTEYPSKTFKSQ